jgi:thiol-disulfide isomerase/thioredoxin
MSPALVAWCSVFLVVIVIAVLVVIKLTSSGGPTASSHQAIRPASSSLVRELSTVPASVFNAIGAGIPSSFAGTAPIVISGQPPLTLDGKTPSMLYYGAEYCPFCAAERWSIAVALARFGTWTGLQTTASGLMDGDYSTLTFSKAQLKSPYVHFISIEACTNIVDPNVGGCDGYTHLQDPTQQEQEVLNKYASSEFVPGNTQGINFPYIDVDNKVLYSGSTYQPAVLTGLTQAEIAGSLTDPTNPFTRSIIGTANYLTASVCAGTGGSPAAVCSSAGVKAATSALQTSTPSG